MRQATRPHPGPNLASMPEEVLAVLVAFGHRFDFDAHDALDHFRVGAVDGELEAAAQEGVRRLAGDRLQRQHAVAAGGFGVGDHLLDQVLDVRVLRNQQLLRRLQWR